MVGFAFKLLVPEGIRKFFTAAVCGLPCSEQPGTLVYDYYFFMSLMLSLPLFNRYNPGES